MSRLGEPNKALVGNVMEIAVPTVTLDEYCTANDLKPDWLFIDIEGFEIAALAGARKLIEHGREELGIVVEMHPNVWSSANTTQKRAESLFDEFNLRPVPLAGQENPLRDHGIVHLAYQ